MFNITASWHVMDQYSSYNEWETLEPTTFSVALKRMLDMWVNPQNHQCDADDQDMDSEDFFATSLSLGRGLFLEHVGRNTFGGNSDGVWERLPGCGPQ
jgi:hypothetical protein